jgi:competence protein ComEC
MQLFTASFQMSYGIVAALLLLGLPLAEMWTERWQLFRDLPKVTWSRRHHVLSWVHRATLAAVAVGLATSLVSAITGVIFFKLFTPGSLVANLVLIPISSLVIFGGFYSLVLGAVGLGAVSVIFNHAGALVLWIIEFLIGVFLKVPGVFCKAEFRAPWVGNLALGLVIGALVAGYATRWDRRLGGLWLPFGLTALALILGTRFG